MRLAAFKDSKGEARLALAVGSELFDVGPLPAGYPQGLGRETLHEIETRASRGVSADVAHFLPAVPRPGKVLCVGRNYAAHVAETKNEIPVAPCFFAKFSTTLAGHRETIVPPRVTQQLDYEGELALVIGRGGKRIAQQDALSHVLGYMASCDFSERLLQHLTPQWLSGKGPDGFAPLGPWITTSDEIADPQALAVRTRVNGETVQDGNTRDMIFPITEIIAYASTLFTLEEGDVILTGTPDGVQFGKDNPRWLRPGDIVEVDIPGVGVLSSSIGSWS